MTMHWTFQKIRGCLVPTKIHAKRIPSEIPTSDAVDG